MQTLPTAPDASPSPLAGEWGWWVGLVGPDAWRQSAAPVPDLSHSWDPCLHTFDPATGAPINATSYTRHEITDAVQAAIRWGRAVEVWSTCPTCAPRLVFAGGPAARLASPWRRPSQPRRFNRTPALS